MTLKDRRQDLGIRRAAARERTKLLIELVPAARGVDDDDFTRLSGEVQKGVRDLRWQVSSPMRILNRPFSTWIVSSWM
jgi:hypothetical protein